MHTFREGFCIGSLMCNPTHCYPNATVDDILDSRVLCSSVIISCNLTKFIVFFPCIQYKVILAFFSAVCTCHICNCVLGTNENLKVKHGRKKLRDVLLDFLPYIFTLTGFTFTLAWDV